MRMRGKRPIFNYRDTWSLSHTLAPIICAGLKKFREVMNNPEHSDWFGVPCNFPYKEENANSLSHDIRSVGVDPYNEHFIAWKEAIDKMIYAFEDNEPNIMDYNFKINWIFKKDDPLCVERTQITNKEEHDRYDRDLEEWAKKREEGQKLFGLYFEDLWW